MKVIQLAVIQLLLFDLVTENVLTIMYDLIEVSIVRIGHLKFKNFLKNFHPNCN